MSTHRLSRIALAITLVALGALGPAAPAGSTARAAAAYAQIEGTGSTWSKNIVDQWIADVDRFGIKVTYTGGGSSVGRKNFANRTTDFGISEIPYQGQDEQGQADTSNGRDFAYLPIVAGGTAFTYHLEIGGQLVKNLRLSGETLAKIFTNQITTWDDAAITKDNNGRKFPKLPITPVVRSDGSGTTAQFTTWLDDQYSSIWRDFYPPGGLTSYYPRQGRAIGAAGSDQVMNTISSSAGNGTIGYVEYSYPVNEDYPVVKMLNRGGYYVEPTQYNVAVALTKARIQDRDPNAQDYLTQILDGVYAAKDPRAYPLSSYSYMLVPTAADDTRMTTAKRQSLVDFMFWGLCEGQVNAGPFGYSPLPLNLVQAGFKQLGRLKRADKDVDIANRDATKCHNPTFVAGDLKRNRLAEIAPQPAACDKVGEGPCGTETGNNQPSTDDPDDPGGDGPGGSDDPGDGSGGDDPGGDDGNGPNGDAPGGDDPSGTPSIDPETGQPVDSGDDNLAGDDSVYANPTELSANRPADAKVFGWVAAAELLALVLLPGLFVAILRRRSAPNRNGGWS